MKIVFVYGKQPSSTLTMLATGSTCYHVGFTDGFHFWDMNLIRRRRRWIGLYPEDKVILAECPVAVTAEYLDWKLDTDDSRYGVWDYMLFRPPPTIPPVRPVHQEYGRQDLLGDCVG